MGGEVCDPAGSVFETAAFDDYEALAVAEENHARRLMALKK